MLFDGLEQPVPFYLREALRVLSEDVVQAHRPIVDPVCVPELLEVQTHVEVEFVAAAELVAATRLDYARSDVVPPVSHSEELKAALHDRYLQELED